MLPEATIDMIKPLEPTVTPHSSVTEISYRDTVQLPRHSSVTETQFSYRNAVQLPKAQKRRSPFWNFTVSRLAMPDASGNVAILCAFRLCKGPDVNVTSPMTVVSLLSPERAIS